ncbi:FecCD family ABC transporter permease [Rhizobium sp. SL86]|uniref:FecCD family ABC transporter permease n=1 Tax=Rhizobium sp. SL86 TaxID=2995148 RepID=UPI0022735689|nr:iron ABC transporter permease [Rhizobium sp. SL86]MCY1667679.1 iron ABC transporter permease [Rhizobium sp. SL86]
MITVFSVTVGSRSLSLDTILQSICAFDPQNDEHLVVWSLRLPRLLIALLAGAALGVSGAIMQAITRNPLAEPGLLGVNAGAAAAVILAISLGGLTSMHQYVWWGFVGAGLAGAAVFLVGRGRAGSASPLRLVLVGAALSIALGSLTGIVVINAPTSALDDFRNWSAGALDGRDMDVVAVLGCCVAVGLLMCTTIASSLNAIALGDELSRALGADLRQVLVLACIAIMLLAGSATAAAGPIGFIGLMAPHLARHLTGPDQRWILLFSGLVAALLLLVADIIGRLISAPSEVAAGIVTTLVGGPVFLFIIRRFRAGSP